MGLARAWNQFLSNLNPVPESVRFVLASRWFWFLVWLAVVSGLLRGLLGPRLGNLLGLPLAMIVWVWLLPGGAQDLLWLLVLLLLFAALLFWWPRLAWLRRVRGLKLCPDCFEEVLLPARVCKHCGFEFRPK